MKLSLTLLVCSFIAVAAIADIDGAWTARVDRDRNTIHIQSSRASGGMWGMSFDIAELTGLGAAAIDSPNATPVRFQRRTDAGTIDFDGSFRRGFGAGQLTFTPNHAFATTLRSLGMKFTKPEDEELFRLAMIDVSLPYIREMQSELTGADLHEVVALRAVGVTAQWLREMRAAGVTVTTAREAKKLCAVGVSAKFVRELAAAGYTNLSVRDLTRLAAVGVDGDFIREMSQYKETRP